MDALTRLHIELELIRYGYDRDYLEYLTNDEIIKIVL